MPRKGRAASINSRRPKSKRGNAQGWARSNLMGQSDNRLHNIAVIRTFLPNPRGCPTRRPCPGLAVKSDGPRDQQGGGQAPRRGPRRADPIPRFVAGVASRQRQCARAAADELPKRPPALRRNRTSTLRHPANPARHPNPPDARRLQDPAYRDQIVRR